jgi:DNA-binding beta-propeller fold protein YncE
MAAGCVTDQHSPREEKFNRVWPEPPAAPRVAYVQSVRGPADLGARRSAGKRFVQWLTGANQRQELTRPFGLALDESDNLCVADTGNGTVCYFDRARKTWQHWSKIGNLPLINPVAVAKLGNTFFVADSGLKQVLAFDANGKLLFALNQPFERPAGLAIGQGKLFVADAAAHRILTFDLSGKYLSAFGVRGTGPGELNFPTHLAATSEGKLFVTDSMNFRIQIFDADGRYVNSIGSNGDSAGYLSRPKGIALDGEGNLYVVDALFGNLQIFDQQGRLLLPIGSNGSGPGEFWLPAGIAISRDNQIYVADTYNRRIQIFKHVSQP